MEDHLIFMHLPKCGGTTFHGILEQMYKPSEVFDIKVVNHVALNTQSFIDLNQQERDKIRLIKGHMEFGLHNYFSGNTEYITFLRHPVERIISYYYYVKRRPNHRLRQQNLFHDQMSLYEFVTKINEGDINNGQVRFISGIDTNDKGEMLEKAKENIKNHFAFVGTIDQFDASLLLLRKRYRWEMPYYQIENNTKNRPSLNEIDLKTIASIEAYNKEDISLYNDMKLNLEELINQDKTLKFDMLRFYTCGKYFKFKAHANKLLKQSYHKLKV